MTDTAAFYISVLRKDFSKYCSEILGENGVTYGQMYILIYLGRHGKTSPSSLCEKLKLDAGHLNRTAEKLINGGFIIREKNPDDKRASILFLTEKGEEIFSLCRNLFSMWDEKALSSLNEVEKQQFISLLKKITVNEKGEN